MRSPERLGYSVGVSVRSLLLFASALDRAPSFRRWAGRVARSALLVLAPAGCSPPEAGTDIRFGLATAPVTLDPRFATDATSARVVRLLYARLVDFDAAFRPVPALASWRALSGTRYRFTLRTPRARFSDGEPVRAGDVKATYEDVLDPERGSPHRAGLTNIASIRVVDPDTVEFRLERPDLLFPGKLVLGILPARRIAGGHPFNTRPVGSGPFVLEAWPESGRLVLRRRRDGQRVRLVRISEPNTRVLKLLNGEVDLLAGDLAPETVRWLEGRPDVRVERHPGTKFAYLGFNLEDPVVGRLAVRRAVAYAIDRRAIIRHVMGAAARPASALLPPGHWAGAPGLGAIHHDLARARKLLREAGYENGTGPKIVYTTSAAPFRIRLATIIQSQLARAGMDVEIRSYDWGTFYGDIKAGRFQMYSLAWVGIKMPDIFRYVFHSGSVPPEGANRGRFRSQEADRLIELAESAPALPAMAKKYRALQRLLLEELPYVPLWYEDNVAVSRPALEGFSVNEEGNYDALEHVHWAASR